jgi:hypothetical protein
MSKRKRFTDSEKWTKDRWFRKLSQLEKLFWLYINDTCDHSGAWYVDFEQASFHIGSEVDETTMQGVFQDKVHIKNSNGSDIWWIKGFCHEQYTTLIQNETSAPRASVEKLLKSHGVYELYCQEMDKLTYSENKQDNETDLDSYFDSDIRPDLDYER